MDEIDEESDRQKFVRLANRRVNNALRHIRLIGNLSNKSNYDYRDEDITKIFGILTKELEVCRQRFENKKKKTGFVLEE